MNTYRPLLVMSALILGAVLVYMAAISLLVPALSERGQLGDSFGMLTSVFSGLAFAGMVYAILMQSQELRLQREELTLTRTELVATRKEQERAANAQAALVEQQILAAKINGLSALVQSRYQFAAAHGANAYHHVDQVHGVEKLLLKTMEESGLGKIDLPPLQ